MSLSERSAELDRAERGQYLKTWRVVNDRRAAYSRKRANKPGRGRKKHRKLRADHDRLEQRFTAAVAGLRSAVAAFELDPASEEYADLAARATNALKFAEDQEAVDER